jgi:hypothetical protein
MVMNVLSRIFRPGRVTGLKIKRTEAILALLDAFWKYGKKKVSLSEFQVAAMDWQRSFPLGYSFSDAFLYSYDLFEDLSFLEYEGEVSELVYRHDGFLPKSFIELSASGLLRGQQVLAELSEEDRATLDRAVAKAVDHYYHTWRLWSRPELLMNEIPDKSSHTR